MISRYTLANALKSVGNAEAFVGDPFTASAMVSLGATEGRIRFRAPQEVNALTSAELTGGIQHQATVTDGAVQITVPIVTDGDLATLFAKISPKGIAGGGSSTPTDVFTTSLLILPRKEIGGGLSWNVPGTEWVRLVFKNIPAANGAPAAPKGAVWFWRCYPTFDEVPYTYEAGGKQVVDVTFNAMWYDGVVSIPDEYKVWIGGDPRRVGVAIPVIL